MNEEVTPIPLEYKIASYIYKTFTICFLITGTLTNALSALVYSKKHMRKTSYSIYLFSLAIVDFCVTLNGNLRLVFMSYEIPWLQEALTYEPTRLLEPDHTRMIFAGVDVRLTSLFACRLHRFLTYSLMEFSSIILSALSIDRFFGCVLVLKSSRFCKPSVAVRVVAITVIALVVVNLHFLIFMGYEIERIVPDAIDGTNRTIRVIRCEAKKNTAYFSFWQFYFYLDSAFYCFLPFLIMVFCNISIISKIVKSRIRSKQVIISRSKKTNASVLVNNSNNSMLAAEKRISIILVLISLSFLVLTAPVFVLENLDARVYERPGANLILSIAYALMYSNHVINFFFYCSLGPNFRKEVKRLIGRGSRVSGVVVDYKLTRINTVLIAAASTTVHRHSYQMRRAAFLATTAAHSKRAMSLATPQIVTSSSQPVVPDMKMTSLSLSRPPPPPRPPPPRPPPPNFSIRVEIKPHRTEDDHDNDIIEQTSL